MKYYDAFSKFNPVTCFIYYICAVILSVIIRHPFFIIMNLICILIYFFIVKKNDGWKFLFGLLLMVIVIALINPLFNTYGTTKIFYFSNGRIYSFEAFLFGIMIGLMLSNILIIFSLYNNVLTNDKFIYLFANISPSLALVTSMSLRLVPEFKKRIKFILDARSAIGKGTSRDNFSKKVSAGSDALLSMTNWAFEDGIITADSMRARGYGICKRTAYKRYTFSKRDFFFSVFAGCLIIYIVICIFKGGAYVNYYPKIDMSEKNNIYFVSSFLSYGIFVLLPVFINIYEVIRWHYLLSKI